MEREEAIAVIKYNWPYGRHQLQKALETIIPELKETEDEKMRREIIKFLKSPFVNENITDEKVSPWIKWLEKGSKWNERDNDMVVALNNCLSELEVNHDWNYVYTKTKDIPIGDVRTWVNTIKDRMN